MLAIMHESPLPGSPVLLNELKTLSIASLCFFMDGVPQLAQVNFFLTPLIASMSPDSHPDHSL